MAGPVPLRGSRWLVPRARALDVRLPQTGDFMQNWEYKIVVRLLNLATEAYEWSPDRNDKRSGEEMLDACGREGWELVSVVSISYNRNHDGLTTRIDYFFKRPVLQGTPPKLSNA
jgi:hypothetical protein